MEEQTERICCAKEYINTSEKLPDENDMNALVDDMSRKSFEESEIQDQTGPCMPEKSNESAAFSDSVSSAKRKRKKGSIRIFFGPMYSGKSSRLITELQGHSRRDKPRRCILITNKKVKDDADGIVSVPKERFSRLECFTLKEALEGLENYDVIAIDEAQFFPDIVEICEYLANQGKEVLVAALDGTFQREPFGEVLKLLPKAENVEKLRILFGKI